MTGSRTCKRHALALLCCACLLPGAAIAQSRSPEQFNGADKTGTQGVVGNPNCPPPIVHTADGTPITPLNWSCDSSGYWPNRSPYTQPPVEVHHPGPPDPSDPNNPCLVRGHDYDWRNNPPGTYLPAGCERPSNGGIRTIYPPQPPRRQYQPINRGFRSPPPTPPYDAGLQPGYPGEYLGPNSEPLPAGWPATVYPYRRTDLPRGHLPPEIYIQRIPQMPAGQIAPGR